MLTGYLYINFYNNTYTTAVCEVCACVRGTRGRVCGGYLFAFAPVMLHVVLLMLFQEINKHSYGRLCVLLSRWRTSLFHDVGVETYRCGDPRLLKGFRQSASYTSAPET